jgi:hypothetical protein
MESWNDERMDELSRRVDAGFEKTATKGGMNQRFDAVNCRFDEMSQRFKEDAIRSERFESKVETEFHRLTDRLDRLFYIQLFFLVSLAVALLTDQA